MGFVGPRRWFASVTQCWRANPVVGWLIVIFAISQLVVMGWDLPGSFGWENDGIAPRGFLSNLLYNLTPGQGHHYPMFHSLLLVVVCAPFLVPAVVGAGGLSGDALDAVILTTDVMTGCAIMGKLLSIAMACVAVAMVARVTTRLWTRRAGQIAAALVAVNIAMAYYGRATNLDGPMLMWTVLAVDRLLSITERGSRRDYIWFGVLVGFAIATKDQGYASFVFPGLLLLFVFPRLWQPRPHLRRLMIAVLSFGLTWGVLSGAAVNPTGFVTRLSTMTGSGSQDWRMYDVGASGVWANLGDIGQAIPDIWWPWTCTVFCFLGVVVAVLASSPRKRPRAIALLPLAAGLSFLVCFTLVVARSEARFLLPTGFWMACYGGIFWDWSLLKTKRPFRQLVGLALIVCVIHGAWNSAQLSMTQLGDVRWDVREHLAQLPPGSTVETYGILLYLPHFDTTPTSPYTVFRVGPEPENGRNPILGVEEVQDLFMNFSERNPDVLIIAPNFANRFHDGATESGRQRRQVWQNAAENEDARQFFRAVANDALPGYSRTIWSPTFPSWARALGARTVRLHGSTGADIWVFERSER